MSNVQTKSKFSLSKSNCLTVFSYINEQSYIQTMDANIIIRDCDGHFVSASNLDNILRFRLLLQFLFNTNFVIRVHRFFDHTTRKSRDDYEHAQYLAIDISDRSHFDNIPLSDYLKSISYKLNVIDSSEPLFEVSNHITCLHVKLTPFCQHLPLAAFCSCFKFGFDQDVLDVVDLFDDPNLPF